MRVGLIGLGRMGEVCPVMMKEGIDVYVTEETTTAPLEAETSGYITKGVNSIQDLVHLVSYDDYDHKVPGVYQLVISELVKRSMSLYHYLARGDIIIDHGNNALKILCRA